MSNNSLDGDHPLDPVEMLALLEQQKRAVDLAYMRPVAALYTVWGVAWLVGFLLLWSASPTGNQWFQVPMSVAATVFGVLIVASIITSAIVGIRIGRGVRGASDFQGAVYGMSWSILGIALAAIGVALLQNGMSTELASLYFPSAYAVMAGIMYLFGAALWNEKSQLELGLVLLFLGALAPFFGAPANNLVMALGGVAFLIAAAGYLLRIRKAH
jgi:hypothetical protein